MRHCQTQTRALADFFGRKKGIENPIANGFGYTSAVIANRNLHHIAVEASTNREFAQISAVLDDIGYRM